MGRPRKPTALLEQSGSFDAHPERRRARENEPRPGGPLGAPPDHLTPKEAAIWREVADLAPEGMLTIADRCLVEIVCALVARLRAGKLKSGEVRLLISCLSRMGLTSAARARLGVARANESGPDAFAELANPRES